MRISDWSSDVCSSDLEIGDAEQPVGVEHAVGTLLHLVIRAVRDAPQKHLGVLVADTPAGDDVKESADRGWAQPLPLGLTRQVDEGRRLVARRRVVCMKHHCTLRYRSIYSMK